MKLKLSCYTIFIIIASANCGLVKNFLGNVKEDVHSVVDNTVNIIGKGTHKITEGLGVFLHRNEGNKFPGHQPGTVKPTNQFSNGDNINNNDDEIGDTNGLTDNKHEENTHASANENNSQYYNPVRSTPATAEHTLVNDNIRRGAQNGANDESESSIDVSEGKQETTTNKVKQLEATTSKNIQYQHTMESTATDASTTETDSWLNAVELQNILPNIKHNDTHFAGNKSEGNAYTESYTDTNELGTGDKLTNTYTNEANEESNNKKAKGDGNKKPTEIQTNGSKADLVSDQMFFKDNKPKPTEPTHYICAKPLVRAANGECLEPIEIDVRKKNEPRAYNIFQAEVCASGYARALDNTCQRIVG